MAKRDYTEMATRFVVAAIGSKNRWRRVLLLLAVVAVLAVGAAVVAVRGVAESQQATLDGDWRSLQACMLGAALDKGETPATRLAAVQLGAAALLPEQRSQGSDRPWPASCAPLALALGEHAAGADKGGDELQADAKTLGNMLLADQAGTTDLHNAVEKVWEDAARAQLTSGPDPQARLRAPKPAVTLFTNQTFRDQPRALDGDFALSAVHAEPALWGDARFLVDDAQLGGPPLVCTTNGMRLVMDCERVPVQVAKLPSPRLLATVEPKANLLYFSGDRGESGVFRSDGRPLLPASAGAVTAYGAASRGDGSAELLARKDGQRDLELVAAPASGPVAESLGLSASDVDAPEDATILWDWLLWRSSAKAPAAHHLMARRLKDYAPPTDAGALPAPPREEQLRGGTLPTFTACRTDDSIALRVRGADADAVALFEGGRWSAPQNINTRGGVLTCRAHEAVVTAVADVEPGKNATIEQSRCDPSGCAGSRLELDALEPGLLGLMPDDAAHVAAVDVGGRLALVWSAGSTGGLRMRVAPIERMKATPDVVVFDGRDDTGASRVGLVTELRMVPAAGYALLFVNTTAGARAFRVGADGRLTPVRVGVAR